MSKKSSFYYFLAGILLTDALWHGFFYLTDQTISFFDYRVKSAVHLGFLIVEVAVGVAMLIVRHRAWRRLNVQRIKIASRLVSRNPQGALYVALALAVALLIFDAVPLLRAESGETLGVDIASMDNSVDLERILSQTLPAKTVLPVRWQGIPYRLVEASVLNIEGLKEYSQRYGQTVSSDDLRIFDKDYNEKIVVTPNNSVLVYNVLWAVGFVGKSPVLDYEREKYGETVKNLAGYYFSFANLGNRSTLPEAGFNYLDLTPFTPEQSNLVLTVAGNAAVPSCGNSLLLPDCSCSFAIVALINLMTSQGFNEEAIYQAMKAAYPYRFPGIYVQYAVLYKLAKNLEWDQVPAQELVSQQFSSSRGVHQMRNELAKILSSQPKVDAH